MSAPKFGDRVRTHPGSTGRYIGWGLVLCVSAQDNDLFITDLADGEPHPSLPVPSDDAMAGAHEALTYARWKYRNGGETKESP